MFQWSDFPRQSPFHFFAKHRIPCDQPLTCDQGAVACNRVILDGFHSHEGLPFYTIGQRKGLGISASEPLFVLRKDVTRNALIVGPKSELGQQTLIARDVNWLSGNPPQQPIPAQIKIRYKAKGIEGEVVDLGNGRSLVTFHEPVFGVTAGQGAVFYDGDVCLGGGIIADGANDLVEETAVATPTLELANIQVLS